MFAEAVMSYRWTIISTASASRDEENVQIKTHMH